MGRRLAGLLLITVCDVACLNRGGLGGATSTMSATPPVAPADGNTPIMVSISVAPAQGTISGNTTVVIASSDPNAIIVQPTGLNAQTNTYVATVRSLQSGTQTLTASLISGAMHVNIDATTLVTFNPVSTRLPPGVPDPNETTLTANPNQVSSDGSTTTLLTLDVRDSYGVPVFGAGCVRQRGHRRSSDL